MNLDIAMMKTHWMTAKAVICAAALGFGLVISSHAASESRSYEVDEAYRVYSVLLPTEESYGFATGRIVIQQETVTQFIGKISACIDPAVLKDFKEAAVDFERENDQSMVLEDKFEIEKPHTFIRTTEIKTLFQEPGSNIGGLKRFYSKYPGSGGFIILSAVGFNKDKTQAIAYTGSGCGNLCGMWRYHLLKKIDGKWKEVPGVRCTTMS
jgi:hypothetical protein